MGLMLSVSMQSEGTKKPFLSFSDARCSNLVLDVQTICCQLRLMTKLIPAVRPKHCDVHSHTVHSQYYTTVCFESMKVQSCISYTTGIDVANRERK